MGTCVKQIFVPHMFGIVSKRLIFLFETEFSLIVQGHFVNV